jgi:hypothetical protein
VSYAPASLDLNGRRNQAQPIRCGDDYVHVFTFVTGDEPPVPINKTGSTWLAQIRKFATSSAVIAEFTVTVTGADSNLVSIILSETQTALLEPGEYVWDLQEISGSSTITCLAGEVLVEPDVSRS